MHRYLFVAIVACALASAGDSHAKLLYINDFDGEAIGSVPTGWEKVFDGASQASVIDDPVAGGNQVLASSDLAHDASRHDVGGSIFAVGDDSWTDYVVDYDALFPADFRHEVQGAFPVIEYPLRRLHFRCRDAAGQP